MFISFAMILIAVLSVLSFNPSQAKDIFSSADIESYNSIVNDLPEFFEIYRSNRTSGDESEVGYVGDTINLFQTGAFKKVTIADKTVEGNNFTPATEYDPSKTYYGYGIILPNDSSVGYVNFDNAMFKGPNNDPSLNFYAKKDVTVSGELSTGGANASLTFGNAGTAKLNCAALNANDLACTYTMKMVGNDQIMTITVSDSAIAGKFTVDATGKVTFVVTEVTGSLASAISIGASLTNN